MSNYPPNVNLNDIGVEPYIPDAEPDEMTLAKSYREISLMEEIQKSANALDEALNSKPYDYLIH